MGGTRRFSESEGFRLHTPIKLPRFVFLFFVRVFLYGATTETAQSLELGEINSNLDGESSSSV